MFSSIFNPCTIKLHLLQNVLFMSPPTDSSSVPSDDPLIRGVLEVHCPSDRIISGIEIKLKASQSVALIDSGMHTGTEDEVVFEKTINLGLEAPESSGSLANQTRSPSPTTRSSIQSNEVVLSQDHGRISGEGYEPSPPRSLRRRSTLDSMDGSRSGISLSKGFHGFEFSILLPSSSPPYERSVFGRVIWILSATAIGAGRAKTNLTVERPLFPVVNPNPDGSSVILSTCYHDLSPVGLVSAEFSSENLCVGGALSIDIQSPEPKEGVKIHLVKVSIESSVTLETKKQGINRIPKRQNVLFSQGYVSPQTPKDVGQGNRAEGLVYDDSSGDVSTGKKSWSVGGFARLPSDNIIRPTTLLGSSSAIRWTHNLLMQIVYSFPETSSDSTASGLKVFSVRNPIVVPSCCASHDAVRLPQYEPLSSTRNLSSNAFNSNEAPPLMPDSPWFGSTVLWPARHEACTCGQSLADLETSIIPRRSNNSTLVDGLRQSKLQDCTCPDSPSYSSSNSNPNGNPYPSPPDSTASASNRPTMPTRRTSSAVLSTSPSRVRPVDESFGIPSLRLGDSSTPQRTRSVELDGDPPTYQCALDDRERGS